LSIFKVIIYCQTIQITLTAISLLGAVHKRRPQSGGCTLRTLRTRERANFWQFCLDYFIDGPL